ncbi:MarR family transcriptional regulator [Methanolobus sp.]|uniref:MarR family transcriptional regulator n=1 Tax=Methanolobus sp. TaxID=1874737 RepID=UPI0025E21871|nr:MarR family transcriptional regulator [Methanolobus sp.]
MTNEYAEQLFLQEKPALALLAIWSFQKTYASVITKEINSTFAHTTKILSKMEEHDLVRFSIEGRVKYVELTEHGYKVVDALKNLIIALEGEMAENLEEDMEEQETELSFNPGSLEDRVLRLYGNISSVYEEVKDNGEDPDAVKRKIGPFSRDIQLLIKNIEQSEDEIDDISLDRLSRIQDIFDTVMKQEVKFG